MRTELPTQEQIIEELADRVAAQIESRRPVAFDSALEDLVRYHRFLLGLGATTTTEGDPYNYAEVAGMEWHPPHFAWLRQYRRLFELAAERIPESDHFLGCLAYTLARLLRLPEGLASTPAIDKATLDLFPSLMHAVERWVTRRAGSTFDDQRKERRVLAGSDAKAHAAILRRIMGAWESLLQHAPVVGGAIDTDGTDLDAQWQAVRRAWPFMWNHLTNTAYCLALCVWNEDGEGALVFREALVRWPENYRFMVPDKLFLRRPELLFPDVLEDEWETAQSRLTAVTYDHRPQTTPGQLLSTALDGVHADVLQLVAGLFAHWTVNGRPAAPLAAKTALELLGEVGAERHGAPVALPSSAAILLRLLRLQLTGGRHRDGSYGAQLDSLVRQLDHLTERDVVSGRTYTPSTIYDREETLWADVALMAAMVDNPGEVNVTDRIQSLGQSVELLPFGDRSVRDILHELRRYRGVVESSPQPVLEAITKLGGRTSEANLAQIGEIITGVEAGISNARIDKLRALPVAPQRLELWRAEIIKQLLERDNLATFPSAVIATVDTSDVGQLCTFNFPNYPKAQLVEPLMEEPPSNETEVFAHRVATWADERTFSVLNGMAHKQLSIDIDPLEPAFWSALCKLVRQVGPAPRLTLPMRFYDPLIDVTLNHRNSSLAGLEVVPDRTRDRGSLCQIEGVKVGVEPLDGDRALLFSGERLQQLNYGVFEDGFPVRVSFVPAEGESDVHGMLQVQFRQAMIWATTPTFVINLPQVHTV